jgi:hypothetical protein
VTITEKYYAKWNKAQQDLLDADLTGAWGKPNALESLTKLLRAAQKEPIPLR